MTEAQEPKIQDYFRSQKKNLALVTASGLIYNIGLVAGPWYEGQMAQALADILAGDRQASAMASLALSYVLVIAAVQLARMAKRFYVRRFANEVNRQMKKTLYANLVRMPRQELEKKSAGAMMTRAVSDVDECVEGMRKFTTEIFDTGVAMAAYIVMLVRYDARLALLCMIFPPVSYALAEHMKRHVQESAAAYKKSAGELSQATLDRAGNALLYRVYGVDRAQNGEYEKSLADYQEKAVRSGLWENTLQPLYRVISYASFFFILYFGAKNVLGTGWAAWDIAAFTTFLSCYEKWAVKSSHAAKLFNAVQKAQVSWQRIRGYLKKTEEAEQQPGYAAGDILLQGASFTYPDGKKVFAGASLAIRQGEKVGVAGPVASGKSTFGKVFLNEQEYGGSITFDGREIRDLSPAQVSAVFGYMGHDPECMSDTIKDNILLGKEDDVWKYLKMVKLDEEVREMPQQEETRIGEGGMRLSGGQKARVALARTLAHPHPVMILDDPFSSVDMDTEREIWENMRSECEGKTVILISHRLSLFPQMDHVLWIEGGKMTLSDHQALLKDNPSYRSYDALQKGGSSHA